MERRPPTPAGCLMFNIRQISMLIAMIIIGYTLGEWIGGEKGARIGIIIGVLFAVVFPWGRLLRLWFKGDNGQDGKGDGEI